VFSRRQIDGLVLARGALKGVHDRIAGNHARSADEDTGMRMIRNMIAVCALLLLAMVPACVQFSRASGLNFVSLMTLGAGCAVAFVAARRA
jgi:hypothetical protein